MSIRITCISKAAGDHENPYVAISTLGWHDELNPLFKRFYSREEMYDFVAKGGLAYVYDRTGTIRSKLEAVTSPRGTKYVRSIPNFTVRDNLLELSEC